jgi:hypothetical protein
MFPLSRIEPFSVPFPRKGLAKKRAFAKKTETTYVIKISKLYNWLFYVGREVSGSVYHYSHGRSSFRERGARGGILVGVPAV